MITSTHPAALSYSLTEGESHCLFLRGGPVAAQLLLTSGADARLLAAFAAGNSGAAAWFHGPVAWTLVGEPEIVERGKLAGARFRVEADRERLVLRQGLAGSIRVLRDFQCDGRLIAPVVVAPQTETNAVRWTRTRLDGQGGYELEIRLENGYVEAHVDGTITLVAAAGQRLRLCMSALTGDTPLTPMAGLALCTAEAADLPEARRALEFLAYQESWLAGSWRFHSYFGRDTLMSLRLLLPVLQPEAAEAALTSVLLRLSPSGQVAHEESLGEFPMIERLQQGRVPDAAPLLDYKMVDDDFMLLPVFAAYAEAHAGRVAAFLARRAADGRSLGERLARNAELVLGKALPFVRTRAATDLVRIQQGERVGDWRDSQEGLGDGVYAYSVNAALVPAALRALASLGHSLGFNASSLQAATEAAEAWETDAPRLFAFRRGCAGARAAIERHAGELGVDAAPALASLANLAGTDSEFAALSLDEAGRPVPVLHSDFSFALLFCDPPAERIERELSAMMRPFPAGLMTGVGLLVANAAFDEKAQRQHFGPDRYHGAVVWSWQQALLAAGLARQLRRADLDEAVRSRLREAQAQLWRVIQAARDAASGELWSWRCVDGRYELVAFGSVCVSRDESNAAQLWSTVYLAVQPPREVA